MHSWIVRAVCRCPLMADRAKPKKMRTGKRIKHSPLNGLSVNPLLLMKTGQCQNRTISPHQRHSRPAKGSVDHAVGKLAVADRDLERTYATGATGRVVNAGQKHQKTWFSVRNAWKVKGRQRKDKGKGKLYRELLSENGNGSDGKDDKS